MDMNDVLDWVNDNKIVLIAGAIGVAFLFATLSKNNTETQTVVTPVSEGSSYPTISENADMILSNVSSNILGTKQELQESMDSANNDLQTKMDNLKNDILGAVDAKNQDTVNQMQSQISNAISTSNANTDAIMDVISMNQKNTLDAIEFGTMANINSIAESENRMNQKINNVATQITNKQTTTVAGATKPKKSTMVSGVANNALNALK